MSIAELDAPMIARWMPPPQPRPALAFAKSMLLPDGPAEGENWDPESEPIQRTWVEQLDNPRWQVMVAVAPSQRGKSLMGIGLPLLRTAVELRQNVAYVMPNLEKLDQNWHGKIKPMLEGCGFGAWLPGKGPGARGGKPAILTLRDPETQARAGSIYFMAGGGGGKETSLASVTAPKVVVDEADDLENEGQLGLVFRRTKSFGDDFQVIIVSTVNDRRNRDAHPILIFHERGTRSRLWYACPHCQRYQPMEWEAVIIDPVGYQCAHCPKTWDETDRHRALNTGRLVHHGQSIDGGGRIIGDPPAGRAFSLLAWDGEFHRASLAGIVAEYNTARKSLEMRSDHSPMRQFHHKVLCRDYRADIEEMEFGAELTWRDLLEKSQACKFFGPVISTKDKTEADAQTYSRHIASMPEAAQFSVGGVDIQNNRVYWSLVGFAVDGTTYDAGWGYEFARLDHMPWSVGELHQLLDRAYQVMTAASGGVSLDLLGLDVGDGEHLKPVTDWLKGHRGACVGTKGLAGAMKPHPGDIDGLLYIRDGLHLLNTDNLRELIHAAYRRPNGTPGSAHIPSGLANTSSDTAYLRHIVAEMRIFDHKTRKEKIRHGPGRWDWQDARRIAEAMGRLVLARMNRPKPRPRKYGAIGTIGALA